MASVVRRPTAMMRYGMSLIQYDFESETDDAGELLLIYFRFGLFFCLNLGIDISAELLRIETQNYADNYGSARQGYIIHYFWVLWDVEVYLCKI